MTTAAERIEQKIDKLASGYVELASLVGVIAKRVYKDDSMFPYEDDEEGEYDENGDMSPVDAIDEELPIEAKRGHDSYRMSRRVRAQRLKTRRTRKGYANSAQESDEHDAKFDAKDSDIKGNEASPAGEGNTEDAGNPGAEREDESFGPGGMAYSAMRKEMASMAARIEELQSGQVVAKAPVPSLAKSLGRPGDGPAVVVTREMEEQAKNRSYQSLNRLREEVGDMPTWRSNY